MLYFLENHDEQRIASDFFAASGAKGVPGLIVSVLMRQNPFMLYAGQEFGESGMDKEGFSGVDGRTTIFDYWSVPSVFRGYYDRRKQTREERMLEAVYAKVLNVATNEQAVAEGEFYDLMYANSHIGSNLYAFLRKYGNEVLLVVANFSSERSECDVNIPEHAFDFLDMPEGGYQAEDLLTDDKMVLSLSKGKPVRMSVGLCSGRVWKFCCKQ